VVLFSFAAKAMTVHCKSTRGLDGFRRKLPSIRRKQPRPAQNIAFTKGEDVERATAFRTYRERHFPLADEIEFFSLFTLSENELPTLKADTGSTPNYEFEVTCWEVLEKRILYQNALKVFHANTPLR
jgi:hypothetical protein